MVTCKFKVDSITMYQHGAVKVSMTPVYSTDPNHPNKAFWDATPSGLFEATIKNGNASAQFEVGAEYLFKIEKA